MTQLFLHSEASSDNGLNSVYEKAVSEAVELYIFSAYLTHWDVKNKLNDKLKEFKLNDIKKNILLMYVTSFVSICCFSIIYLVYLIL